MLTPWFQASIRRGSPSPVGAFCSRSALSAPVRRYHVYKRKENAAASRSSAWHRRAIGGLDDDLGHGLAQSTARARAEAAQSQIDGDNTGVAHEVMKLG